MVISASVTGYGMKMATCNVIDQVICHIRCFTTLCIANIKLQIHKVQNPQLVIAGIVAFLLGTFGIGVVMAWGSGSDDVSGVQSTFNNFAGRNDDIGRVRGRCPECGIVESSRLIQRTGEEIDADVSGPVTKSGRRDAPIKTTKFSEVTIRMNDGTSHQFLDENQTNWRRGERVIFIAGANKAEK